MTNQESLRLQYGLRSHFCTNWVRAAPADAATVPGDEHNTVLLSTYTPSYSQAAALRLPQLHHMAGHDGFVHF